MVSLGPSFQVIGYNHNVENEEKSERLEYEEDTYEFMPPLATWFDRSHQHFVAFWGGESTDHDPNDNGNGEVVHYRVFRFPSKGSNEAYSKEKTEKQHECQESLDANLSFQVFLPYHLSRESSSPSSYTKGTSPIKHVKSTFKIPILAKFSLDMQLLALQISSTLLIIVRVQQKGCPYWAIDLKKDYPPSFPEAFPEKWDQITPPTTIISGGVIWSDHGGNSQDLILITTTAVIFYKVSVARNQIAKSHTYNHLADAHWYEPTTRTLLVGSFIPHENKANEVSSTAKSKQVNKGDGKKVQSKNKDLVFVMQTYFLQFPKASISKTPMSTPITDFNYMLPSYSYGFLGFDLPQPDRLPLFVVGSQRLDIYANDESFNPEKMKSIASSDVSLVNIYNEAYCIEVGCYGYDEGISIIHLDKKNRRVQVIQSMKHESGGFFNMSVVDNLLAFHYKEQKVTFLYDIRNSGELKVFESSDECDPLYDDCFSLLPPNLLLDPRERGQVYKLQLNLMSIVSKLPLTTCITPFLLNRKYTPDLARSIILERLTTFIETQDIVSLKKSLLLESIAEAYSMNDRFAFWDMDACLPLLFRSGLLPPNYGPLSKSILNQDSRLPSTSLSNPSDDKPIITQTEILEKVLLPQAEESLLKSDLSRFEFIGMISCSLMENLTSEYVEVCPALETLVIAMLWRLGHAEKVLAILRSRRNSFGAKYKSSRFGNNELMKREIMNIEKKRKAKFSEMMVIISIELHLGIGVRNIIEDTSKLVKNNNDSEQDDIFTQALKALTFDLMCANSSCHLVATHLLDLGRVEDAIIICMKIIESSINSNPPNSSKESNPRVVSFASQGTNALDFFRVAILHCENMDDIGDRVRHLTHLFSFLSKWDPRSIAATKVDDNDTEKSPLAKDHPNFPYHLFGGETNSICKTLCAMYGY